MTPLLLVVPLVLAAPVPKDFKPANAPLDGTWAFVSASYGGNPDSQYDGAKWVLGKDGGGMRHVGIGPGVAIEFKADPKAKTFDWMHSGSTWAGIYEIKGDTLRVALGSGDIRPTEFGGPSVFVFTMKKRKK